MSSSAPPPRAHVTRVDVLRAVAILLVFTHHYWLAARQATGARWTGAEWDRVLLFPWAIGYLGVKLFFVISGFCIHLSFLNWRRKSGANDSFLPLFFWRRFWRIYPPYIGALVLCYLLQYSQPLSAHSLRHFSVHALMLQNFSQPFFLNINPSFWSISVEWQLYLVYPLVLWLASLWRIEGACLFACLMAFGFTFTAPCFTNSYLILKAPFAYWFEWVVGALVAEYFASGRRVFRRHGWFAAVLCACGVWAYSCPSPDVIRYALPTLLFAVLLEGYIHLSEPAIRIERLFVPVGLCSYSLYLFHQPYLGYATRMLAGWLTGSAPIVWGVIPALLLLPLLAVCAGYYRWVELGSIALGRRWWDARAARTEIGVP